VSVADRAQLQGPCTDLFGTAMAMAATLAQDEVDEYEMDYEEEVPTQGDTVTDAAMSAAVPSASAVSVLAAADVAVPSTSARGTQGSSGGAAASRRSSSSSSADEDLEVDYGDDEFASAGTSQGLPAQASSSTAVPVSALGGPTGVHA
jgi:hypothetical protein